MKKITKQVKMRSYSGLGMKFLLAIGLFSTAFSCFLIYHTWKESHDSLYEMLGQQAELAMAFEIAIEDINTNIETRAETTSLSPASKKLAHKITTEQIFEKVQKTYPQVVIRASGDQLSRILSRAGTEGDRVCRLFENNPAMEDLDRVIKFNNRAYLAKFRMNRNDVSLTDPYSELRMIAIPLEGYRSQINEQTLSRLSPLAFALLGLFGAIYCSFELLVGRRLKRIAAHFCREIETLQYVNFTPLEIKSKDEIGLLATSFNRLRERLNADHKALDAKVRKRTFELQQANSELRHKILECQHAESQAKMLAEEATVANRAKNDFLANMSHELRTPMNAILGFSQILSEENLEKEQLSYLRTITNNASNLKALIDDILDYTKIEIGKLKIEKCDCRIGDIMSEIESTLRPAAITKGIKFEILQCDVVPEIIQTDPLRLRQCLNNLITNAIKFTETGYVYVNILLQDRQDETYIQFDIEDTGIGISKDKCDIIFKSFTQVDTTTTRKYGGTGLGLSITQKLIELLGGTISVVSTEGVGSLFSIQIPIGVQWPDENISIWNKYQPVDEINELFVTEKGTTMYNGKVLVAEDNISNQKLINILLKKLGLEVTLAADGLEAVEECSKQSFDIILMDMQMPNLNGYDATRQLRSQGVKTPIIAVTANAMTGDEDKCIDVGCDGYLSKPIDRNKLEEIIGQHLAAHVG